MIKIQEISTFEKILMALRELEAWEERKIKVNIQLKNSSGAEREDLTPKLTKINQQIKYYNLLTRDMKREVKPSSLPDLLNALVASK